MGSASAEKEIRYIQDTLFVLNGKWKLPILWAVQSGNTRFRDIKRSVEGITAKVLSKELKELVINKLIIRTVYNDFPVSVEYTTAPYCDTLRKMIKGMIDWGKNHRQQLR